MATFLKFKEYYASVYFSEEDNVFFGKLLGINDLVSFESSSVKGLTKAFCEAAHDYRKTCREIGKTSV